MKILKNTRILSLLLTLSLVVMMATALPKMSVAAAGLTKVELGTTSTFAVLAGTEITNTGATIISGGLPEGGGNVGVSPGSAFTVTGSVTMTGWNAYLADTADVAKQAQIDLTAAYLDAEGRTVTTAFTASDNQLGGKTLTSGVYAFGHADTANLTAASPLILDAEGDENAVFIFKASSDLITASGSEIILRNGARFCRVFWQVTSSATLGTNSHFVGHIFALTSITANTGATIQGQLLARNAKVTLNSNIITNALCLDIVATTSETASTSTSVTTSTTASETTLTTDSTTDETTASELNLINGNPNTGMAIPVSIFALLIVSLLAVLFIRKKV